MTQHYRDVQYFVDAYDDLVEPIEYAEFGCTEFKPLERAAARDERHLTAAIHVQVEQFFAGLASFLTGADGTVPSRELLVERALAAAERHDLGVDLQLELDVAELFTFMLELDRLGLFDTHYSVAFAVDGSVSLLAGPQLPNLPDPSLGLTGGCEHDHRDLGTVLAIARECTGMAAELRARTEWPDERFDRHDWAAG